MLRSLQIIAIIICCTFLVIKFTVGLALYLSHRENDWRDIYLEMAFLVFYISVAVSWLIALFKPSRRFYLFTSIISIILFIYAIIGLILVLSKRYYVYEDIFVYVGVDRDDIPFYSLLLAFIWIVLWSIPTAIFLRLWSLEKSSPVPHAVYKPGTLLPPA